MTRHEAVQSIVAGREGSTRDNAISYAPANIALCKYWGKRNAELNLPVNSSVSVSLRDKGTHTQLTRSQRNQLTINEQEISEDDKAFVRLFDFLGLFCQDPLRVETRSTIPIAAGLASSASAFASMTLALNKLQDWQLTDKEMSMLARLGSGSASRSIYNGFVEWHAGSLDDGMDSFAERLDVEWPEFRIGVLTISESEKPVGSREGMNRTVAESALYRAWPDVAARDLRDIREAIVVKDFELLGACAESNAMSMHGTMLGCRPPLLYWRPDSVSTLEQIWHLRSEGLPVYATMDAGPNIKLLFLENAENEVKSALPDLQSIAPFTDSNT